MITGSEIFGTAASSRTRKNERMRTITTLAVFVSFFSMSSAEGWLLKSPYRPNMKSKWKVVTEATVSDHAIQSIVTQTLKITSNDGKAIGTLDFTDMEVNGNRSEFEAPTWPMVFSSDGMLIKAGEGADCLRQLAPTTFTYPNKEVSAGSTWESNLKFDDNGKGAIAKFTVVERTMLKDQEVLKVKCSLNEESGLHSEGLFWIAKDGRVLKYQVDAKNWVVAGSGLSKIEAKLSGELMSSL